MPSDALHSFLQALLLLGSAFTALKLFSTGLYKKYPIFFFYFLFRVPNSIWPLVLDYRSKMFFYFYIGSLPILLVFYILLVRELYRLVLEDYRGLQTAGRWAMYASVVGAVGISIMTLIPGITPSMPQTSRAMGIVVYTERGIDTALALFIILLLVLLSRYPIKLRRNVRVHALIYSIFFLNGTAVVLARAVLGRRSLDTLNTVNSVINAGCVFAWLFLLNRAGEEVPERKAGADSEQEKRLLLQLQGLNSALLRVSRK